MLRAAFRLSALLFIPAGLFLYFFPPSLVAVAGFSPLWLVRVMGGLLLSWGVFQVAASAKPDGAKLGGLVGGNLLTVATLLPDGIPSERRTAALDAATATISALADQAGVWGVRVHDVLATRMALRTAEAWNAANAPNAAPTGRTEGQ